MRSDPKPRRRPMRLPGADYTRPGGYFVTICAVGWERIFDDDALRRIVEQTWRTVIDTTASLEAGDFVVMPNHVHGIVWLASRLSGSGAVGTSHSDGTPGTNGHSSGRDDAAILADRPGDPLLRACGAPSGSLGAIVGSFKAVAAKRINRERRTPSATIWQRGYYDRIIRSDAELDRIRLYILDNPSKWLEDIRHPENSPPLTG